METDAGLVCQARRGLNLGKILPLERPEANSVTGGKEPAQKLWETSCPRELTLREPLDCSTNTAKRALL